MFQPTKKARPDQTHWNVGQQVRPDIELGSVARQIVEEKGPGQTRGGLPAAKRKEAYADERKPIAEGYQP